MICMENPLFKTSANKWHKSLSIFPPFLSLFSADYLANRRSLFRSGGCSTHARPQRSALTAGWLCRFFIRRCCCYCRFRRRRSPHHAVSCCPDTNLQELDLKFCKRKQRNYTGKVSSLVWRRLLPQSHRLSCGERTVAGGKSPLFVTVFASVMSGLISSFRTAGLTSAPAQPRDPQRGKFVVRWSFIAQMTNLTASFTPDCLFTHSDSDRENVAIWR